MARVLLVAALLIAVLVETPVTYAGPRAPDWLSDLCDDRTDDVMTSWLVAFVTHDAYGVAAPPPTAEIKVDSAPVAPAAVAHPAFRLRGPPARTSG
jgi:hypothetical protein